MDRTAGPPQGTAGLVSRILAALVDAFTVAGIGLASQLGAGALRLLVAGPPFRLLDPPAWLSGVCGWVIAVLYLGSSWTLTGTTAGDRLLGLRVTDRSGGLLGVPAPSRVPRCAWCSPSGCCGSR